MRCVRVHTDNIVNSHIALPTALFLKRKWPLFTFKTMDHATKKKS
jgi:hypothetical protein